MFGLWFIQSIWFLCTEMPFCTRLAVYRIYHSRISRYSSKILIRLSYGTLNIPPKWGPNLQLSYNSRKWMIAILSSGLRNGTSKSLLLMICTVWIIPYESFKRWLYLCQLTIFGNRLYTVEKSSWTLVNLQS